MKPHLFLFLVGLFITSCFPDSSKRKMEAENLILSHCKEVNEILNKKFKLNISDKKYVYSCGCVSEILSDEMASKFSLEEIKALKKKRSQLNREMLELMLAKKKQIVKKCN